MFDWDIGGWNTGDGVWLGVWFECKEVLDWGDRMK